jgi:hypothetical protein
MNDALPFRGAHFYFHQENLMPKLSQLSSIVNGEIPVVLIFVENDQPKRFEVAKPEEAVAMLAVVEVINETKQEKG